MRKRAMPDGFFPEGYPASLAVATVDVKDEPAKDVPAPAAAKVLLPPLSGYLGW